MSKIIKNMPPQNGAPNLSLLTDWLDEEGEVPSNNKTLDPQNGRKKRWKNIGWEVYERKALLLRATKTLEANGIPEPLKLAVTDIFVEKAQRYLTIRGRWMYIFGAITSFLAMLLLGTIAYYLYHLDSLKLLSISKSSETVSNSFLAVLLLKATTAAGFIGALVYLLVSLSRALLHEATVLLNRRHSLRFGRLYVYLMSDKITREDLEMIFGWNAEFSTAFKDIQAKEMTKSGLLTLPVDVIKTILEVAKGEKQGINEPQIMAASRDNAQRTSPATNSNH